MDITDNFETDLFDEDDDDDDVSGEDSATDATAGFMLREQDRFLPICNIIKIMKTAVPDNGKIAKDARECIQECVSEFISFITSEAIDRSHSENRKTVNGDDLIYAFSTLGFENYVEPLTLYLHKHRETIKPDRNLVYQDLFLESSSQSDNLKSHQSGTNSTSVEVTGTSKTSGFEMLNTIIR